MVYNSRNLEALFDLVGQQTHTSIQAGRTLTSISPEALTFLLISAPLKNMSDFSYITHLSVTSCSLVSGSWACLMVYKMI